MEITWSGTDALSNKLKRISREFPRERDRFLAQEAELLKARAKKLTPADTGRLRAAWSSSAPSGGSVEVFNDVSYASHVEWGHRVKIHGKFTGKVVPGVFMLRDALEESRAQFVTDANAILARLFK